RSPGNYVHSREAWGNRPGRFGTDSPRGIVKQHVMAQLLNIPFPLRLIAVMVVAAVVATWLNAAIYAFAWRKRSFSPWQAPSPGLPPRTWLDRVPLLGWWRLRRERYPDAP